MIAIKIKESCPVEGSKFFGAAFLPDKLIESDEFSFGEVFICQINLSELAPFDKKGLLPDSGWLYFFMDFDCKPVKGIVRYSESADAYTFFNEDAELDYDVETEYAVEFSDGEADNGVFAGHKKLYDNEVCLLKFTPDTLGDMDFLSGTNGSIMFVIDRESLSKRQFDKAFLINVD